MEIDKFIQTNINGCTLSLGLFRNSIDNLSKINNFIPLDQLKNINKYKFDKDKNKRLIAKSFLYKQLSEEYGVNDFTLIYNEHKKPFLKKHCDIYFSLSYSKEFIFIGISSKYEVGVDIEYINKSIETDCLSDEIMHSKELSFYNKLTLNNEKQSFFFKAFNIKESIIKAIGTGLFYDIKNINILDIRENNNYLLDSFELKVKEIKAVSDYKLAVCINAISL